MMNGAQQIVGGLLAYCFSLIKTGPLQSWKWLFLIYGAISIIFGLFVAWWMPDSPMRAKCFSEEDKTLMIERVRDNQTGIQNRKWKKHQFVEGLKDPQIWGYCLVQLGFTVLQTQLLAMVLGFYIIIVLLGSTYLAKLTNQNLYIMGAFVIPYVSVGISV
jgi:Na+/melibiose symporter-like transporter